MITCYRFSKHSFKSQFQEHLAGAIASFHELKEFIHQTEINTHQKNLINSSIGERSVDENFKLHGVFVFLKKPTINQFNHYLNHLDKSERPSFKSDLNIKEFDEDTVCYIDDGFCFCKDNKTTLKEAKENEHLTVFIPC